MAVEVPISRVHRLPVHEAESFVGLYSQVWRLDNFAHEYDHHPNTQARLCRGTVLISLQLTRHGQRKFSGGGIGYRGHAGYIINPAVLQYLPPVESHLDM